MELRSSQPISEGKMYLQFNSLLFALGVESIGPLIGEI
jgi:hypothetical protein